MEDSIRVVFLSVLLMVFGIVVGFTFYYTRNAEVLNNSVDESLTDLNVTTKESKYAKYVGTDLNGTDVTHAIDELQDEIAIKVILDSTDDIRTRVYQYHNTEVPTSRTDLAYISPADQFRGTLIRNENSTVVGIKFERIE